MGLPPVSERLGHNLHPAAGSADAIIQSDYQSLAHTLEEIDENILHPQRGIRTQALLLGGTFERTVENLETIAGDSLKLTETVQSAVVALWNEITGKLELISITQGNQGIVLHDLPRRSMSTPFEHDLADQRYDESSQLAPYRLRAIKKRRTARRIPR